MNKNSKFLHDLYEWLEKVNEQTGNQTLNKGDTSVEWPRVKITPHPFPLINNNLIIYK